jgi:hypothetical protein
MTVGEQRFAERKAAGEALIAFVRKMKPQKPGATALIAAIGGFTIVARTSYFDDIELRLDRALKSSDAIAYEKDVTPLGLVSRLESALGRFDVELAEERRTVSEVSGWLPGFKARLGDAFPHETELEEKRAEMAELDASLAATASDARATPPRNSEDEGFALPFPQTPYHRRTTRCCPQQMSARSQPPLLSGNKRGGSPPSGSPPSVS